MQLLENYSPTIIEIFRILYFSEIPQTSGGLQQELLKRGISLDSRTIRYHLANLEEQKLIMKNGKKGARLTSEGIEEAKGLLVFDRVGIPSFETEKMLLEMDFNPSSKKGRVIVNFVLIKKPKLEEALEELSDLSGSSVIVSPLISVVKEGERLWNCSVPADYLGLVCVSSMNYDAVLKKTGIPTETIATGLYRMKDWQPRGFSEIISHHGTTISPGELLIRGRYTSISEVAKTGRGHLTAAVKTFPSFLYDKVISIIENFQKDNLFNGIVEKNNVLSPLLRMSARDRNKGYFITYGGANYFAPLVEKGITGNLKISSCLYPIENMTSPSEIIKKL